MQNAIYKQLTKKPKFLPKEHISYYSDKVLGQVHMDTLFWRISGWIYDDEKSLVPILVIVDVSTRFCMFFLQPKKSSNISDHLSTFIQRTKDKFQDQNISDTMLLITDGAPEFKFLQKPNTVIDGITINCKVSTGVNKAVLAESAIARIRRLLMKHEIFMNVDNVMNNTNNRIDKNNLQELLDEGEDILNNSAHQIPKQPDGREKMIPLLTPVFMINLEKYFPAQTNTVLQKKSYHTNYYYEPYYISYVYGINGRYKYKLHSCVNNDEIKGFYYADELQVINPEFSEQYIKNFNFQK